jgi:TPR repeat protein
MNNLGNIYRQGIGTSADFQKALHYYQMAADRGDTGAMSNLATLYLHMTEVENYE